MSTVLSKLPELYSAALSSMHTASPFGTQQTSAIRLWLSMSATGLLLCNKMVRSFVMGQMDDWSVRVASGVVQNYGGGLGTDESFDEAVNAINLHNGSLAMATDFRLEEEWKKDGDDVLYARASFLSPIGDYLHHHENVRRVQVQIVIPARLKSLDNVLKLGRESGNDQRILIQLPATGDEGFAVRRYLLAKPLARDHGIVSIIVQLPFYGARRRPEQSSYTLYEVDDTPKQSLAAVMETNALLNWLTRDPNNFTGKLGVTGVSFGGSMSGLSSVMMDSQNISKIAIIAHIPANSPDDAYVLGALSHTISFDRLAPKTSISAESRAEAYARGKEKVHSLLKTMDIARGARDLRQILLNNQQGLPPPSTSLIPTDRDADVPALDAGKVKEIRRVFIQLSGLHDAYIPPIRWRPFYEHISQIPGTVHSELIELEGGHCTGVLVHFPKYYDAILRAFSLL